jgi:hypothetical protein
MSGRISELESSQQQCKQSVGRKDDAGHALIEPRKR